MAITGSAPTAVSDAGRAGGHEQLPWPSGHNGSLDGLRVIAASAVLVTHVAAVTGFDLTGSPASWLTSRGDVGVPIFFTLSGLLLFRPWVMAALTAGPTPSARVYLARRALRILPAYWLVVVVAMLTLNRSHARSAGAWAQYLLLGQIYDPHPWWHGTGAAGLAQMWSLAVEASFYLLLPVLGLLLAWLTTLGRAGVAARAKRMLIAIAVLGCLSYGFIALTYYPTPRLWLDGTLLRSLTWFAPGMALAVVLVWARLEDHPDGPVRSFCAAIASSGIACWLIAGSAFVVACTPVAGPETLFAPSLWNLEVRTALYTVIALAVVAPAAFQPDGRTPMGAVLGNRVMRFLGKISYGIFLWQYVAIFGLFALLHIKDVFQGGSFTLFDTVLVLLAAAVVSCAIAAVSFYVLEQPIQRLYRSGWPGRGGRHKRSRASARTAGGA